MIYVNAGVTHPVGRWLEALRDGGRLILPLTSDAQFPADGSSASDPMNLIRSFRKGVYFRIERRGTVFEARGLFPVMIIPAEGVARERESEAALTTALEKGGWNRVTRLVRGEPPPQDECWLRGPGWALAY